MKSALLIGINKYAERPLSGCLNDVADMACFLERRAGFHPTAIDILCDARATKGAILNAVGRLVDRARPGDQLLVHFSGHSSVVAGASSHDEVLCPFDFAWTAETAITTAELCQQLKGLPTGATLTFILDTSRGAGGRFLPPPVALPAPARVSRLRDLELTGATVVMACDSDEAALEIEWAEGITHGAFTSNLLSSLRCSDADELNLTSVVEHVRHRVTDRGMHPTILGSRSVLDGPYWPRRHGLTIAAVT
jgi:metacaspase-1